MILGLTLYLLGLVTAVALVWVLLDLEAALFLLAAAVSAGLLVAGVVAMALGA